MSLRPAVPVLLASFLVGALLGACGTSRTRCATVVCDGIRVCDEATGACVLPDGGLPVISMDGGDDAGETDAGVDAGLACVPDCVAPQVCDRATGRCVQCFTNADCACPSTQCNAQGLCEAPPADAGLPAGGEACASAPIVNTCGQSLTFSADLAAANDDVVSSCGAASGGGKDLLWTFVLDATADVRVTARAAVASLAQPVISLRRSCRADEELACTDALGGTATFRLKSLAPGAYTVVVDSYDAATSGRVDVTVDILAPTLPPNETCATAAALTPGTDVTVDLSTADDDLQVSCNSAANSPEAVFAVTLSTTQDLVVTATGTGTLNPALALRRSPCATGAQLSCFNVGTTDSETLIARSLAAGTYYVIVERVGPAVGTVTVRATLSPPSPPPANDTCAAPRAITFPQGSTTTSFSIDTSLATDSTSASCNTEPNSPEAVYSLTLSSSRRVSVTATASAGTNTDAVLYLRSAACDEASGVEVACNDAAPPGPDSLSEVLAAGTYYLFVEGFGPAGAGPTDVTVTLGP